MADFTGLGKSVASLASTCANNADRSDIAAFLIEQHDLLHGNYIKNRDESKAKKAANATGGGKAGSSAARDAYKRMLAADSK